MVEQKVKIINSIGLHARPASLFVKEANQYLSDVQLIKDTKNVNGKSIMGIMSLGAKKDEEITIRVNGEDEEVCLIKLIELIESGFGEK